MREPEEKRAGERVESRGLAARGLLLFGVLVAAAIVAVTAYEIGSQRQGAFDQAQRELSGLNGALAEHTERVVATIDYVVSDVVADLGAQVEKDREPSPAAVHKLLRDHVIGLPMVASLIYLDAEGVIRAHSNHPQSPAVPAADRPYFKAVKERPAVGLYVSEPFVGRITPRPQIALSRAIVDRDGRFRGAIAVGLDAEYFVGFYREVVNFAGGSATLYREDARMLVSFPNAGVRDIQPDATLAQHFGAARRGHYRAAGPGDGQSRLVVYRALGHYPLLMAAGFDEEMLLSRWRSSAWRLSATAVLGIAVVWLLVGLILRRMALDERQARRLAQSEEQFRVMVERASDALILHDPDGRIVMVNQLACATLGYTCLELTGCHVGMVIDGFDFSEPYPLWQELSVDHPVTREYLHRRKDGTTFPVEVRLSAFDMAGRRLILALARDISERKAYQARLEQQANYDLLTGLPNRMLFLDRLQTALAAARRNSRLLALLFIDLDGFKNINDMLGHPAGDALLVESGRRIAGTLREADTVARFGGDEFVVLLAEMESPRDGELVAAKIRESFRAAFDIAGRPVAIRASIGVALFPDDAEDADTLIGQADTRMYQAKEMARM